MGRVCHFDTCCITVPWARGLVVLMAGALFSHCTVPDCLQANCKGKLIFPTMFGVLKVWLVGLFLAFRNC